MGSLGSRWTPRIQGLKGGGPDMAHGEIVTTQLGEVRGQFSFIVKFLRQCIDQLERGV